MIAFSKLARALVAGVPALAMLAAVPIAAQSERPLAFRTVFRDRERLDGQVIVVRGYVESCGPTRCLLFMDRRHASQRSPYALSIGPDAAFDRQVRDHGRDEVVLRARLEMDCMNKPPRWATGCGTRPATLSAVEIVRWD